MSTEARFRALAFGTVSGFIAAGFGSGLAPRAPGTVGSLAALPIGAALLLLPLPLQLMVIAASLALGVWACDRTGNALGISDYGGIVWDEFVGLWIALLAVPTLPGGLAAPGTWAWIAAAFVAFRVFDIAKPPPIRQLDRGLKGGWGVMVDDVVAGLFAAGALWAARYLLGAF